MNKQKKNNVNNGINTYNINTIMVIGADHGGYELKEDLIKYILDKKYTNFKIIDVGTESLERTDYPIYAELVGKKLIEELNKYNSSINGNNDISIGKDLDARIFGILICKSGHGMTVAANKVKGVRASLVNNETGIKNGIEDDDINVFCVSSNDINLEKMIKYLNIIIDSKFKNTDRYVKRINQIENMENNFNN